MTMYVLLVCMLLSSSPYTLCSKEELNMKGKGGQTPLMFAVLAGKEKSVVPLLEAG